MKIGLNQHLFKMDSRVNVYKNRPKSPINRTSQLFNYRKYLMLELAPEALI